MKPSKTPSKILTRGAGLSLALLTLALAAPRAGAQELKSKAPERLVVVPRDAPWLVAAAAPVAAKLGDDAGPAGLLAVGETPSGNVEDLAARLAPKDCHILSLEAGLAFGRPGKRHVLGGERAAATLALARIFWGKCERVIISSAQDPESVILGAALAAHEAIPLLLYDGDPDALARGLAELGCRQVSLAQARGGAAPAWASGLSQGAAVLDRSTLDARILKAVGANIRTVVLARAPDSQKSVGSLAWLAPYWSLARRGPIVLDRSGEATAAEGAVLALMERAEHKPRSLTILASYASIPMKELKIDVPVEEDQEGFNFPIEPCAFPQKERAALALGVGRILLEGLDDASALLLRGLARDRLAGPKARALMLANPFEPVEEEGFERHGLPLCEAVSQVTVHELRNFGVETASVLRKPSASPEAVAAAETANLIVYQGHLNDQALFEDESFLLGAHEGAATDLSPQGRQVSEFARRYLGKKSRRLRGDATVILQSCKSLSPELYQRIVRLGGSGLVGSVTNIHSASGSTFIDALIDRLLYDGATLGEALRSARNYYLLFADLKEQRGHSQGYKSLRVALSFRVWGDPELVVFPSLPARPNLAPVHARWVAKNAIEVSFPRERLPAFKNELYELHLFPNSKAAGLVQGKPGQKPRRILPVHFFRLPLRPGFLEAGYTHLSAGRTKAPRAVFRVDSSRRFVTVLYFPAKDEPATTKILRFKRD